MSVDRNDEAAFFIKFGRDFLSLALVGVLSTVAWLRH